MSLKLKKRKKIIQQVNQFKSIDTLHKEKTDYFNSRAASLPKKLKKLELMKKKKQDTNELENEIRSIENHEEEIEYWLKTSDILRKWEDINPCENATLDIENLSILEDSGHIKTITKEYYNVLDIPFPNTKKYIDNASSFCKMCETELIENGEKFLVCVSCGVADRGQVIDSQSYKDMQDNNNTVSYNYKRINYFIEWITQIQAKENVVIDEDILDQIKLELRKRRVFSNKKVSYNLVRKIMKELNMSKYYEHIPLIICNICGTKPINIPAPVIDKMKKMFMTIQHPFELFKDQGRINFLSYPYVFYKFCELLNLNEYLSHFSLLKTREKLINQDILWKKIVNHLYLTTSDPFWRFIPSC